MIKDMPLILIECLEFTIKEDMRQCKRVCLDYQKKKRAFHPKRMLSRLSPKETLFQSNPGKFLISGSG